MGVTPCNCGDFVTSSYTLTSNLVCPADAYVGLLIYANNVVLDGGGYSITGSSDTFGGGEEAGGGYGIDVYNGETNAVVRNFAGINGFRYGVFVQTNGAAVQNNIIANSVERGISIQGNSNTVSGNTVTGTQGDITLGNAGGGIFVNSGSGNTFTNNVLNGNLIGIFLGSGSATLSGNSATGNRSMNYSLNSGAPYSIDTTNLSEGNPVYYLNNVSNQTYDGGTLGLQVPFGVRIAQMSRCKTLPSQVTMPTVFLFQIPPTLRCRM